MSADNGIYIMVSPISNSDQKEYRVAHGMAIENLDYYEQGSLQCQAMEIMYYDKAPMFFSELKAVEYAVSISKDFHILEYGICLLEERKFPYSDMSFQEAALILK